MSKESISQAVRQFTSDRTMVWLSVGLIFSMIVYVVITALSVHASDVTVYTRYTSFGETHFYKAHWQYHLAFVLFGVVVASIHQALMVKLFALGRRQTALIVAFAGVAILVVGCAYALAVMQLGRTV